ncbi:helix-turn-helix transcriptional regulator [Frankia sp. Cas3]|uniref:helix-turn-helix transcriptional regulator n=1 Tax=Frankia sp. Cas3 TaxID=3073926 RepID=UPI002AD251DC|nr:helix-turn-helix transcriptional regulator [Frankia sp. Cas3]
MPAEREPNGALAELSALLRQLIATTHTNNSELARRTGYRRQQIAEAVNGHAVPSEGLAKKLDEALEAGGRVIALREQADKERKARRLGLLPPRVDPAQIVEPADVPVVPVLGHRPAPTNSTPPIPPVAEDAADASDLNPLPATMGARLSDRIASRAAVGRNDPHTAYPVGISILTEGDVEMTARKAADHAAEAATRTLSDLTIDQLEDDLRHLATHYGAITLPNAYQQAQALLEIAQRSLERTRAPRQLARLYLLAGEAAALCGSACFDLSLPRPAAQFARTAALYGQTIEFGPLQAFAHGTLAYIAYWQGRPAEGVRHALAAAQAPGVGTVGRRRIAAITSRAWAHVGDAPPARAAMAEAEALGDPSQHDDLHDIDGEFGMSIERVLMSNAATALLLGDAATAGTYAQAALDRYGALPGEQRPPMFVAQAQADLANARLVQGDADGAVTALDAVLALPVSWRGTGLVRRVNSIRLRLLRPDLAQARALRGYGDAIEDWAAMAPA